MKRITPKQAFEMISAVKGCTFLTIFFASPQDKYMRKTGNPFHGKGLLKECAVNGVCGFDYGAAVNRLAAKEGKEPRLPKGRAWGELSADRKWVTHKGETYIQLYVRSATDPVYRIEEKEIPADEIKPFQYEKGKSSTQADLEGEVVVRDIKMSNILSITFKGEVYLLSEFKPISKQEDLDRAAVNERLDALLKEVCDLKKLLAVGDLSE